MPMYCQRCSNCGTRRTVVRPINQRNRKVPCSRCGKGAFVRDMPSETVNSTDMEYDKPVYSEALGVSPDQVSEHRRQHPNIPITDDGRVILTSHNQRNKVLKTLGFHDKDGFN